MNIHEYQAKDLLRQYGIPVPLGRVVFSPKESLKAAQALLGESGGERLVVKAQIHAGGRGKAGGVKLVKDAAAAQQAVKQIYGKTLVTRQTGSDGKKVQRLLIEAGIEIARELYLAMLTDRESGRVEVMASTEGGVEIEEVAAATPGKIIRFKIDPALGLMPYQARRLAFGLGLKQEAYERFIKVVTRLSVLYSQEDCLLVEINPLVVTEDNRIVALDVKLSLDDNAAFRHPRWADLFDPLEENSVEIEAKKHDLNYVQLKGDIGCLVNGAGLAMATMDIIKHFGGEPANFLDVGGGASTEAVTEAFKIILQSPEVKGILVNIFGGIMRCDVIASGIIQATEKLGLKVPLVVRIEGTNAPLGREILRESGLAIVPAATMAEGARKIVELVGKRI
ncbi:MAG: ADP-forming succinate--CoA ligase subunit beta [Deltaproteobacteria bacterium]|nr:ADP-forming succinate--CoA ligase subunit beta [Deltaproteobacteria bacterium]